MSSTDTNRLLKDLAESINQDSSDPVYITVVAGGQLISGRMISEDEFFELNDNVALKDLFNTRVKGPRLDALNNIENGVVNNFANELKEYFIYLKNVSYLNAKIHNPSEEDGVSVQIRVSDISVFSYRGCDLTLGN